MKKKRFIKLLMAMGYSRNEAAANALSLARDGCPYDLYYRITREVMGLDPVEYHPYF